MPRSTGKTTASAVAATLDPEAAPLVPTLVILASNAQPHRAGEVALFPVGETLIGGRRDDDLDETCAEFVRQRLGETPAVDPREELLAGKSISRRQFSGRGIGTDPNVDILELTWLGGCPMYVNGQSLTKGAARNLRLHDTVMLQGEALLMCLLRPRVLVLPLSLRDYFRQLHPFGEADAYGNVGESPEAWRLRAELATVAASREDVLILGETGTGKERVASTIHQRSPRAKGPFVTCNMPAILPSLLAAELFGNVADYPERGMKARKGIVGEAEHGTVFLDEIGDFPEGAQSQLFRLLEQRECQVVGASSARRVDVRVVAATNREDSMRPELRARFRVHVYTTPLRKRPEDIALLAPHVLLEKAREDEEIARLLPTRTVNGRVVPNVSLHLVEHLVRHALPENVRELQRILVKAVYACREDKLTLAPEPPDPPSLPPATSGATSGQRLGSRLPEGAPTREEVLAALEQERGNVSRAAKRLGIGRNVLRRLMEVYGID